MARPVYMDKHLTEYDDGSTEVGFTAEEWEVMLTDPAYGYVCRRGHRLTESDHRYIVIEGICPSCAYEADDEDYED